MVTAAGKMADQQAQVRPLDEATLARVAETIGGRSPSVCFRLGLYLGLSPTQVDSILQGDPTLTPWQRSMQVLTRWRERGEEAEDERLVLAQALVRLDLGRLSSSVDRRAGASPCSSFINPSSPDFTPCELEEISRSVGTRWNELGVRLGLSEHAMSALGSRKEEPSLCAFRCLWAWYEAGNGVTRERLASALTEIGKGRLASRIRQ